MSNTVVPKAKAHSVLNPIARKDPSKTSRVIVTQVPVREDDGNGFPFGQFSYPAVHVGGSNAKHDGFDGEGWNSPTTWRAPFGGVESFPTPQPDKRGTGLGLYSAIPYIANMHSPSDHIMVGAYDQTLTATDRHLAANTGAQHKFSMDPQSPFTQGYQGGAKPEDIHQLRKLEGKHGGSRQFPKLPGPPGKRPGGGASGGSAGGGSGGGSTGGGTGGLGSCFSGNTIVETRRGQVLFSDLAVGDEIKTARGAWKKISHVYVHDYDGPMLRMFGEGELVTPDHPVLASLEQLTKPHQWLWIKAENFPGIEGLVHHVGKVFNVTVQARDFNDRCYRLGNGLVAHNKMPL